MTEDVLSPLIKEARNFTQSTNQKEICELTGKVADALFWNPSCQNDLVKLQQLLSHTLTDVYGGKDWFQDFKVELDKLCNQI